MLKLRSKLRIPIFSFILVFFFGRRRLFGGFRAATGAATGSCRGSGCRSRCGRGGRCGRNAGTAGRRGGLCGGLRGLLSTSGAGIWEQVRSNKSLKSLKSLKIIQNHHLIIIKIHKSSLAFV